MCGRYALKTPASELVARFGLDESEDFPARYNISPGTDIPVIRQSQEGKRALHQLRWGLVPHWAKDRAIGARLNNARGETVADKPSFRDAFKRQRCLVPADGLPMASMNGKPKAAASSRTTSVCALARPLLSVQYGSPGVRLTATLFGRAASSRQGRTRSWCQFTTGCR